MASNIYITMLANNTKKESFYEKKYFIMVQLLL